MSQRLKIMNIVGTRPNIPKIARLMHEMRRRPAIDAIAVEMPVIFPVHPRTQQRLKLGGIQHHPQLPLISPVGYLDFLCLLSKAKLVHADSGGIQKKPLPWACRALRSGKTPSVP